MNLAPKMEDGIMSKGIFRLIALLLVSTVSCGVIGQVNADSAFVNTYDSTMIDNVEIVLNDPTVDRSDTVDVEKLDSLLFETIYGNYIILPDSAELNIYNYASDEVPSFSDEVYRQRFEEINRRTPIEFVYNKIVRNYINLYAYKKRDLTSKMLGLAKVYFPLFEEHLDKYDMPLELKYLAIVESALNPTAGSRAGAKGLWQFMYGTGRMYGLKATSLVDDRYDPVKATEAACRHLLDLYNIYEDWSLSLAAYNSGAGNVNKAIRRAGNIKSYWAVWPYLPRETRGYVPGFFAVAYVMEYASEHNLYPIYPDFLYHTIDSVTVKDVLSFEQVSETLGIPMADLKFLNPTFKRGIIPASEKKPYSLRLPHALSGEFVAREAEIYAYVTKDGKKRANLLKEIKKASERSIHRVRKGDNLGVIARKYRTTVRNIKRWNKLKSNTIYPGQKLVVYSPYSDNYLRSSVKKSKSAYHVVKKGETLAMISRIYKVKISDLRKWNNLKGNTIYVKQKLKVRKNA